MPLRPSEPGRRPARRLGALLVGFPCRYKPDCRTTAMSRPCTWVGLRFPDAGSRPVPALLAIERRFLAKARVHPQNRVFLSEAVLDKTELHKLQGLLCRRAFGQWRAQGLRLARRMPSSPTFVLGRAQDRHHFGRRRRRRPALFSLGTEVAGGTRRPAILPATACSRNDKLKIMSRPRKDRFPSSSTTAMISSASSSADDPQGQDVSPCRWRSLDFDLEDV